MSESVLSTIAQSEIKYIRFCFTDVFGSFRGLEIPVKNLESFLETGIGIDGSSIGFLNAEASDLRLKPDLTTFQVLPWNKDIGIIICDITLSHGEPLQSDPRTILKKQLNELEKLEYNLEVRPEIEYYVLDNYKSGDKARYMDLEPFDKFSDLRRKIMNYCLELNIPIKYGHTEVGPGQQEIELGYSSALHIADSVQLMKQCIRTQTREYGYIATFLPKPFSDEAGNGLHLHQRLVNNDQSLFGSNNEITDLCRYYIAGLLTYAPNITALINPITNSYRRLVAGHEAPVYISWGIGNRTALIRVPGYDSSIKIEYRGADGASNIYLLIALQLAAGMEGIKNKLIPPEPISENISKFSSEELNTRKIGLLPNSLKAALDLIEENDFIEKTCGKDFVRIFKNKKEKEWLEYVSGKHAVSDWELTEFLNYG